MIYGYVRVSTKEQNEDRQRLTMLDYGLSDQQLTIEKQSGKDFHRPAYQALVKKLQPGDTLVIKSIDRLGRNYSEILEQWRLLTQEKQVTMVVLDLPLLNTQQKHNLTDKLIADIVLQLLSYVAQVEREMNAQRQKEGIAAAKARGVRFGRPPLPQDEAVQAAISLWQEGKLSIRQGAKELGVSHETFRRWCKNHKNAL